MKSRLRILVVGSGGREHALAWKLAQSPRAARIFCAPGNAGMAQQATCVPISASDLPALADFAETERIDLTVIGPELPLAQGLTDLLQSRGLRVFGPSRAAALLESSKIWCKEILARYDIPSGCFASFDQPQEALTYVEIQAPPIVVKADGLAAGKGVTIAQSVAEAQAAIQEAMVRGAFGDSGKRVLIEEYLEGPEISMMALCDGERLYPLPPSQDHKRIYDNDQGPNTGGMGAYSPVPALTEDLRREAMGTILEPTVRAMQAEGRPYVGCLYAGLILTDSGLKVLEFNCRFGDPETQVVLPRLGVDLVDLLDAAAQGALPEAGDGSAADAAVCVVMASGGYPGEYASGKLIRGLEDAANTPNVAVFHAGTKRTDEGIVTAGGRVLGVTGTGDTVAGAIAAAYEGVSKIEFEGAHWRTDIGRRALH
ncbi:MAG: phosphoribosylamine--glycine ligase [Armatimonadota bacterium]|jgi:phosphoribosylamine--glycine ligase